jgi:phage baseplate assembly protein W
MVTKAFSIEDGNLATRSILVARKRDYKDIDLSFTNKTTGEIYKKTNAASVKQAVKNLLLTNRTEKPFQPYYGGELNKFLFELSTEFDEQDIKDHILLAIENYEPRARVLDIQVYIFPDSYEAKVTVVFQIVSTSEIASVEVSLARTR